MTSVTFENAALSEAVKRVARVAPTRGEAMDKAAGIVLEVDPSQDWPVRIKASNLSVYYTEFVGVQSAEGEATKWRVSSELFAQVITKLPIGSGKSVTIEQDGGILKIKSGKFQGKIGLMRAAFYPEWGLFDPSATAEVQELGTRLNQVVWACTKGSGLEPTDGVRFDGSNVYATDKYRLVSVPLEAPHLGDGVTINASLIASLIPEGGSMRVGMADDQLFILPNDYIQIRCVAYAAPFPPVERVIQREYPNRISLDKQELSDAISRVMPADSKNRIPELMMFIGEEEFVVMMEDSSGVDKLMDQIDTPGHATHGRHKIFVNPTSMLDALGACPSSQVTLHYDTADHKRLLYVEGGNGYESWIVPRTGIRTQDDGGES